MANAKFANPLWHLVDAKGQIVGRLATQIVHILKGKHKPNYTRNYDCGDYVVVINAKEVKFTGNKFNDKLYTWHTGHPGGLKQRPVKTQMDKAPEEVMKRSCRSRISFLFLLYSVSRLIHLSSRPVSPIPFT